MIPELRDILFLDIETVACTNNYHLLDERLKTQWARKASYFRKDVEETDEELFNTRGGIYAEFGRIVCIAVGMFVDNEEGGLTLRTKAYCGDDEKELLLGFKSMIEKLDQNATRFCAHNGKEFDYPYICRRMLVNGIPLPNIINMSGKKPWEMVHLDTLEMWKFGDYKHYTSLDLLATLFNIPSSKGDMDGSQVNTVYYEFRDLEKIKTYCIGDVVVMARLFVKLKAINLPADFVLQHAT